MNQVTVRVASGKLVAKPVGNKLEMPSQIDVSKRIKTKQTVWEEPISQLFTNQFVFHLMCIICSNQIVRGQKLNKLNGKLVSCSACKQEANERIR